MWLYRKDARRRYSEFFFVGLSHDTLGNYYKTNFALMQHHKYSLSELDDMVPWERHLYVDMLMNYLNEELEKQKVQNLSKRR